MYCPKKLQMILFLCVFVNNFVIGYEDSDLNLHPIVALPKYGQLQGSLGYTTWMNRTMFQFLNVPYAESPSGSRRFKAPVPIGPWKGIRNAQKFGIQCPRLELLAEIAQKESENIDVEDCLNVAIYSTSLNASQPVMVFLHGGTFVNQGIDQYPPNYLLERDIVLAVVGFRIDVFGFLSTNSPDIPGNAGLMDSIQAIKFIKENIEFFGGDPQRITVFGQSSGAVMISALVISPAVPNDLFQRAIIQSGSIFGTWTYSTDVIEHARMIGKAAGINSTRSITSLNRVFKKLSVSNLLKAASRSRESAMRMKKIPKYGSSLTIGGPSNLLPDLPEQMIQARNFNKSIPIIIGVTQTEGTYTMKMAYDFLAATNLLNDKHFLENDLIDTVGQFLDFHDGTGVLTHLSSLTFWPNNELASGNFSHYAAGLIDFLGLCAFKSPALKFAQRNVQISRAETFLYTFDYKGEFTSFDDGAGTSHYPFEDGITHSDELRYLFPYPVDAAKLTENDTKMSEKMIDLWTSFAINGIPTLSGMQNGLNPVHWQPFNGSNGPYLHINSAPSVGYDFRQEFNAFSKEYYAHNLS